MPGSSLSSVVFRSFYWLLPVIALNVFTPLGLKEAAIGLPDVPLMEIIFLAEDSAAAAHSFSIPAKETTTKPAFWSGCSYVAFSVQTCTILESLTPVVHQHLLCFYGKAAPEALDGWEPPLCA